jgi:hypothetical protein
MDLRSGSVLNLDGPLILRIPDNQNMNIGRVETMVKQVKVK